MADSTGQTQPRGVEQNAAVLDTWRKKLEEARAARSQFEPDWFLNLAYYTDDQWVFWNRDRLDRPQVDRRKRVLLVDNRIKGIVNQRVARSTKSKPTYVATPASQDEADVEASKLSEKVLEGDWTELGVVRKLYTVLFWKEICTAGFWKIWWDRTAGRSQDFVIGQDGQPLKDGAGRPMRAGDFEELPEGYNSESVSEGRLKLDVIPPFSFFPDPLATGMDDLEWAVEERVRSVEYVKDRYNFDAKPDASAPLGVVESRLLTAVGSSIVGSGKSQDRTGVKVYEGWHKPCGKYPNGFKVCWCNDEILDVDEQPFDPMPYVMFGGPIVPGRFWPTSVTTSLRGPQSELNAIKSQIRETAKRLGNPALLWSRLAGKPDYEGLPGEVVTFDDTTPNSKPDYLRPPEVPAYVQNEVERIEHSIQEISGIHEVSRATVPSGVTAASAINLLQEADDTRLAPEVALMEEAIAEAGTKQLKHHANFASEARLVRIAGEDGDWDIFDFRGQMLGDNTNVEVQAGSMMPRSKAAKQAAMTEIFGLALQYGVPLNPRNVRRFFADYEVGGLDRLFADITQDEAQITWENRQLARGQAVPINEFDDDDIHIEGHEEFAKSGRWRRLGELEQNVFLVHLRAHRERRVEAVERQVAAMAQGEQQQVENERQKMILEAALRNVPATGQNGGGSSPTPTRTGANGPA